MKQDFKRIVLTEKERMPKGTLLPAFEVYAEICCDHCNDVVHNHIDCPYCGVDYASTDQYGDLYDTEELSCEECGTRYRLLSGSWYNDVGFTAEVI